MYKFVCTKCTNKYKICTYMENLCAAKMLIEIEILMRQPKRRWPAPNLKKNKNK